MTVASLQPNKSKLTKKREPLDRRIGKSKRSGYLQDSSTQVILATRSLYLSLTQGYRCSSVSRAKSTEMARRKRKSAREGEVIRITPPLRKFMTMTPHECRQERAMQELTRPQQRIASQATYSHRLEEVSLLKQQVKSHSSKILSCYHLSRTSLQGDLGR